MINILNDVLIIGAVLLVIIIIVYRKNVKPQDKKKDL